ncbi:MAG: squalene synthase HpnD, partial [Zetaproteobacteria bacterium]
WARARFGWRPEPFAMVLDGMQWDIDRRPIRTEADLKRYCACVAGAVGVLANAVFGLEGHDALAFALGEALQRTNILRDLAEDAARGRIYIPEERRRGYQVPDEAFRTGALTPKMRALLADEAARAKRAFADARALLACADPEAARPVVAMGAIYRAQLARLERIGFDVWRRRAPLLPIAKVWIAWRAWRGQRAF